MNMSQEPHQPLPLEYMPYPAPRPNALFERLGLHYVAGLGPVAIAATLFVVMTPNARYGYYPDTSYFLALYACSSIPVIVFQFGLLVWAARQREKMAGRYYEERNGWLTWGVGILSGVLMFGAGYLAQRWGLGEAMGWLLLAGPLVGVPIVCPFILLRPWHHRGVVKV